MEEDVVEIILNFVEVKIQKKENQVRDIVVAEINDDEVDYWSD